MTIGLSQDLRHQAIISHAGASATEDIINFGTLYPFLPAPDDIEIVSTSADDTSAGTGVRTVELTLLEFGSADTQFDFYSHTRIVTMDGTTPVAVPVARQGNGGKWYRCNFMRIDTSGSGEIAAGVITLSSVNGSQEIMAQMPAGGTTDGQCIYTIPSDEITLMPAVEVELDDPSNQNHDAIGVLQTREPGKAWVTFGTTGKVNADRTSHLIRIGIFPFPDGTDVRLRAIASVASTILGIMLVERSQRLSISTFDSDQTL